MGKAKGKHQVVLYLDPEIHRALKIEAVETGLTMSEIVVRALRSRTMIIKSTPPESGR